MAGKVITLQRTICTGRPPKFTGRPDAIQWAVAQGAFDIEAACSRYDELCKTYTGLNVYPFWIREVGWQLWNMQLTCEVGGGG